MSHRERHDGPQEGPLGLNISRFDERQRRQRLVLPQAAGCWDYAPVIDLVVREPGTNMFRFAGRTVAEHLALLSRRADSSIDRFAAWYERGLNPHLPALARRQRTPDNHYCIEVAPLPLVAALPQLVRSVSANRATSAQWSSILQALTEKGTKRKELALSGVLSRLERAPQDAKLRRAQVLRMVDLSHVLPKLACESRFGFAAKSGWRECCDRLPPSDKKRRRVHGVGHGMAHVRFRHRSLGWSVARTRFSDLLVDQQDWWIVLDEKGHLVNAAKSGFASPDEAIEFAELQMAKRFVAWGKHQAAVKWERFSLPGGNDYRELLIQLDDWPLTYHPRHFRTRNVLAHVRSSIRLTADGRRVLFLDEVQSDWHADLYAQARGEATDANKGKVAEAPFGKEWPLLTLKIMLWWAQRCGAEGLSWSSADVQEARWDGYGPPGLLYRKLLPNAAKALAKALQITTGSARLRIRAGTRTVELGTRGWEVRSPNGCAVTKPFGHRRQAEHFADLTGEFVEVGMPVLWLDELGTITAIPLYGTGAAARWTDKAVLGSQ